MRTVIKTHPAFPLGNPHPLSDCHTPKENPKLYNYSFLSFSHRVFVSMFVNVCARRARPEFKSISGLLQESQYFLRLKDLGGYKCRKK